MITNKARSLTIDYTPLKPSISMEVVGSVAGRQSFNAVTKEFTPDYTIVPLTLFPRCSAVDPDKYTASGTINSKLTNMAWYDRTNGQKKLIVDGADFTITAEGNNKGQLTVKKNSSVLNPMVLEFTAEYVDSRTGETFKYHESFTVIVSDETGALPVVSIDSPVTLPWNPIREQKEQTITAKLISGTKDLTASANTTFRWYRQLANGVLEAIVDGNGDNDWEIVSVNKNVLKIDRDFIGEFQTYVCKAKYNPNGGASEPSNTDPMVMTTIVRRIPHLECDWKGVTFGVPGGQRSIRPIGYVRDNQGDISNPEEWLKFVWMVKKPGQGSFSRAAIGKEPTIPMVDGMILDLQIEDKGPQAIVVDDNDPNIVIDDGGVLFQRINE